MSIYIENHYIWMKKGEIKLITKIWIICQLILYNMKWHWLWAHSSHAQNTREERNFRSSLGGREMKTARTQICESIWEKMQRMIDVRSVQFVGPVIEREMQGSSAAVRNVHCARSRCWPSAKKWPRVFHLSYPFHTINTSRDRDFRFGEFRSILGSQDISKESNKLSRNKSGEFKDFTYIPFS